MDPTFGTELKTFPGAATAELLPEGALGYYTKNSRFYFTISKDFLKGVSAELDVLSIVDEMIKTYKLDIVSTDAYYGIPLKYSVKDGVTKLYVDRAMILSFRGVLDMVFSLLGDDAAFMGVKLGDIVNKVLDNTTELEIALPLKPVSDRPPADTVTVRIFRAVFCAVRTDDLDAGRKIAIFTAETRLAYKLLGTENNL